MAAEFRLLGEVEVCLDGQRLNIGHARQRCVLAALLVDVNRPVSVDRLIDRVWADDPPRRARNALAGYLSRLRRLLGDRGDVHIARGPAGYTLNAAHPDDVLADAALNDGDGATALAYYEDQLPGARTAGDPIRLVLIFDRITLCQQALGTPEAGMPAAEEAIGVADATGNPTARSLARCTLGRALADVDPDRALELLDQANEIGASVGNNWCTGMAGMESAAIRAVHGDAGAAARTLIPVLDHWEHGGPGIIGQQWDTLAHATRLLSRLGAADAVATLQRFFLDAGREPPLNGEAAASLGGAEAIVLHDTDIVEFARTALRRYC